MECECMICMNVMVEPVTLPCGHTFCYACLKQTFVTSRKCPLDRKAVPESYNLKIDTTKQKKNATIYPDEFKKIESQLEKFGLLQGSCFDIEFVFGNRHELVEDPKKVGPKK